MGKDRVAVFVLCSTERQGWINPELSHLLFKMARDNRFNVAYCTVKDARPFEVARNQTIQQARDAGMDWLVSFDNDMYMPAGSPLDIIAVAGNKKMIGLTCAAEATPGQYGIFPKDFGLEVDGPFREVPEIGGGVLIVHRNVWEKVPAPWFKWCYEDNETLGRPPGKANYQASGCGEDIYFSRLVRQHGFKVWTHQRLYAGHYHTVDLTGMVAAMHQLSS